MNTQALRQKILDLAIRGKLVPQDLNDEPASVLLERIRNEKQQMVKDGKLKIKDIKGDTIIFKGEDNLHYEKFQDGTVKCIEDEIPFEIPEGWVWCRGYSCFSGMKNVKPVGEFFDYIDIETIDNRLHKIRAPKHMPVCDAPSRANRSVNYGSVLFSFVRPYLENIAFVEKKNCHCIASTGFYVCNSNGILLPQYMFLMMLSKYVIDGLNQFMKGDNSPSISKDNIENWLYPIPPITEQLRIIHRIDDIIPFLENVENSRRSLVDSINAAKSKILDLAIRGKLVPQDLNDEPASVLLEHIQAEKEELIKQGKIKRDKNDSVIFKGDDNSYYEQFADGRIENIEDEIPYYLPEGWEWCRVSTICLINPRNQLDDGADVSFVPMPNICEGYSNSHSSDIRKWGKVKSGYTHFKENDIGIAKITPCFENRKSVIFKDLINGCGAGTTELHILRIINQCTIGKYLLCLFKTDDFISAGISTFTGAVGQKRISTGFISNYLVPVPPMSEQKRIVEVIKKSFSYLDQMSKALS